MGQLHRWACGAAFLAATAGASAAGNLVSNGSFDSSLSGWVPSGFGCSNQVDWQDVGGSHAGVARLNACGEDGSDPTITQVITGLTVGATYTLMWDNRVDYQSGSPTSFDEVAVLLDGQVLANGQNTTGNWQTLSTSFVATGTTATLSFAAERSGTDVSYYVDNLAVTAAVPEPGSLALMGVALVALGLTTERRRRQVAGSAGR